MYTCGKCCNLFVDISNTLYCSMCSFNLVVKKSLYSVSNLLTIVAGNGTAGFTSYMLNDPNGIFVDINLDLYVADSNNNRIQLFRTGQLHGTTIAGNGSLSTTIALNFPTGIALDADKNLFIVDRWNDRIVASGPNGFRCLVGCSGGGSASDQLHDPAYFSFDSYGNMFVTDWANSRVQKFLLMTNLCGKYDRT
jgi:DNA-binding beta-propeller fold protein YncE